ncbi:MAG: cell division protein FtsZ [Bacteroidales bacterium]|nr:cell division protein FtsZ [Bacteroidales bacterium]
MNDDMFDIPENQGSSIKVVGVGGGGGNAVDHMRKQGINGVSFVLCNTDVQVMNGKSVDTKITLGASLTKGRGAGNDPSIGERAAVESIEEIKRMLQEGSTDMVFITAGMGGGTGTGAAPVIAKAAKDMGILTVGVVTIPFQTEGPHRVAQAIDGIERLRQHVDSLLVVNNQKIREIYRDLRVSEAFAKADEVLSSAVKSIAEIVTRPGYINVDMADVRTVMADSQVALMGTGTASGQERAVQAIRLALESPLLNSNDISNARNVLLYISYGDEEPTMAEVDDVIETVQVAAGGTANLIWGHGCDSSLGDQVRITVVATGFDVSSIPELYARTHSVSKVTLGGANAEQVTHSVAPDGQISIEFECGPTISKQPHARPTLSRAPASSQHEKDNVPAFRRNLSPEAQQALLPNIARQQPAPPPTNISRITLDVTDDDIVVSHDNRFLHDNVD